MVVGAPTANASSVPPENGSTPKNPGAIFYCPMSTDAGDCSRAMVDQDEGDRRRPSAYSAKLKSDQWLGVSLKSQGPGKYLITCAHRYTEHYDIEINQRRPDSRLNEIEQICGKCFFLQASPCEKHNIQNGAKLEYGKAQAGISISIHGEEYVIGAPGTWAWTGALFEFEVPEEGATDSMVETPTCWSKTERIRNKFGAKYCKKIPLFRDSYMGFSVATSDDVIEDSERLLYAAGAPTGNQTGAVVFFEKRAGKLLPDMDNTVVGDKIGSAFGFAVAFVDVNGDGRDDLLVGAPQYFDYNRRKDVGGAVYVYMKESGKAFSDIEPKIILGSNDSFFGHSIAPLGDLDQDGYNDFAIGAPYEDTNGAVHIFRGGPKGPKESQVIKASGFGDSAEIVGFGSSLSGGVDADGNNYPDLLIGSYSDAIALIRTKPIITVTSTLDIGAEELDLKKKTCSSGGVRYTCFTLSFCLTYDARHAKFPNGVNIKYTLKLDNIRLRKGETSRVGINSPRGSSTEKGKLTMAETGSGGCPMKSYQIYFENGVHDKLTDIEINWEFDLDLPKIGRQRAGDPVFDMAKNPALDADTENTKTQLLRISNTCGKDGCQSGLKIGTSFPDEVVIGENSEALLTVHVRNDGEEAHQAYIEIFLPSDVDFINFTIADQSTPDMDCYSAASVETSYVKCELGNPYKGGAEDTIRIRLSTQRIDADRKQILLRIEGNTTSANPKIPPVEIQAQVIIELSLSLSWSSRPDQVRYTDKIIVGETGIKSTDEIGPLLTYSFMVQNTGRSSAKGAALNVELPVEIDNGKWLLYFVTSEVKSEDGNIVGVCESNVTNVLELEPSREKRSTLADSARAPVLEASSGNRRYVKKFRLACPKKSAKCETVKCTMDEIPPNSITTVEMEVRIWEATFLEEFYKMDLVQIYTDVKLVTDNKHIRFGGDSSTSGTVETTVDHEIFQSDVVAEFPWWYILIGVVLLLVVYIVIIFLLLKFGFFTRRKFRRHEEDENNVVLEEDDEKTEAEHRM